MKEMNPARKINIFLKIGVFTSLLCSFVSLYTAKLFMVWVFLTLGLLFLVVRNLSFILGDFLIYSGNAILAYIVCEILKLGSGNNKKSPSYRPQIEIRKVSERMFKDLNLNELIGSLI